MSVSPQQKPTKPRKVQTSIGALPSSLISTATVYVLPSGSPPIPPATCPNRLNAPLNCSSTSGHLSRLLVPSPPTSGSGNNSIPCLPLPSSPLASLSIILPKSAIARAGSLLLPAGHAGNAVVSKTHRSSTAREGAGACMTTATRATVPRASWMDKASTAERIHAQTAGCRDWCTGRL